MTVPAYVRLTPEEREQVLRAVIRFAQWLGRILNWPWWGQLCAILGTALLCAGGILLHGRLVRRRRRA